MLYSLTLDTHVIQPEQNWEHFQVVSLPIDYHRQHVTWLPRSCKSSLKLSCQQLLYRFIKTQWLHVQCSPWLQQEGDNPICFGCRIIAAGGWTLFTVHVHNTHSRTYSPRNWGRLQTAEISLLTNCGHKVDPLLISALTLWVFPLWRFQS